MATNEVQPPDQPESGWAIGGIIFAASIMILIGSTSSSWGWWRSSTTTSSSSPPTTRTTSISPDGAGSTIIGILVAAGGVGLLFRKLAAALAIALAVLSAIVNFFFIPYYPFWSILIIALNVFVIWAITRPARSRTDGARPGTTAVVPRAGALSSAPCA